MYTEPDKAAVRAIAVDIINNIVYRPMDFDSVKGDYVAACYEALTACEASARRYASAIEAFWRTLLGGVSASAGGCGPDQELFTLWKWWNWVGNEQHKTTGKFMDDRDRQFNNGFATAATGRNFIITDKGYIGWVPETARLGDVVMLFSGGNVPYILRPVDQFICTSSSADSSDRNHLYEFCGDAYIHGIMHGEAYDETKLQDISLV